MARDVKIWKEDGAFKLRVCGVVKSGDLFLVDNCDNCDFYSFAGGHVKLGENTDEAILREIREETGINAKINKIIAIEQLFFKRDDGMPFHEICYYYLVESKSDMVARDYEFDENDEGKTRHHVFKWLKLDDFASLDVRPKILPELLKNGLERQHIIRYED